MTDGSLPVPDDYPARVVTKFVIRPFVFMFTTADWPFGCVYNLEKPTPPCGMPSHDHSWKEEYLKAVEAFGRRPDLADILRVQEPPKEKKA